MKLEFTETDCDHHSPHVPTIRLEDAQAKAAPFNEELERLRRVHEFFSHTFESQKSAIDNYINVCLERDKLREENARLNYIAEERLNDLSAVELENIQLRTMLGKSQGALRGLINKVNVVTAKHRSGLYDGSSMDRALDDLNNRQIEVEAVESEIDAFLAGKGEVDAVTPSGKDKV